MKYTKSIWYETEHDYDGAISATDSEGNEVILFDQYWSSCGHGVEDFQEQIGNIALVVKSPLMYETVKYLAETTTDITANERILKVIESIEG